MWLMLKSGDKSSVYNDRPISLLSKILEWIVHRRLLRQLTANIPFSHWDNLALGLAAPHRKLVLQLLTTGKAAWINCGLNTAALFFDISKAFDKVPHCKLLCSLSPVDVTGPLLQWFQSYLTNSCQRVDLNGHSSSPLPVKSGVPQGSILGPLLFTVYINSLADLDLSPGSPIILYALNLQAHFFQ